MAPNPLDLLQALSPKARRAFERMTERITLPAGHTLFRQGQAADAIYMVVSGSLGVYVYGTSGESQLIALIEGGETVGEMALLSGTPRSATVTAIRDSELLKLTKARFDQLQKREPALMAGLNRILVHRLRQVSRGIGRRIEPKTAAFLPVTGSIDTAPIAERLAGIIAAEGHTARVVGSGDAGRPGKWFADLESQNDHVLLCGSYDSEDWIRKCARQADRIFVIAQAHDPVRTDLPGDLLQQRADHQLLDLVLLHGKPGVAPRDTVKWLDLLPVNRHFHIRECETKDWERLSRVMGGRAIGLVLSGGGARAYAHIGVLQAIAECGLDMDFLGGTSMGAIIAAGIAVGWTIDDLSSRVQDAFVRSNPLSDLTLPLIGLVKGRKVERLFDHYFGDIDIADLWLPYYCVSSNLSDGSLYVHRRGVLADALRASVALPGVLPPMIIDQNVLVDGAVINNLPVDVMRGLHRGPIIACDVSRDRALTPEMLALTGRTSWWQRLRHPPIVSILMRAGTVSSESEIEKQARQADLLIEPHLGDIDIRDWRAFDRAVSVGYQHTAELLSRSLPALRREHQPRAQALPRIDSTLPPPHAGVSRTARQARPPSSTR